MLALPVKDAFDVFKGVIARVDSDFSRRRRLATLGMDLARAWQHSHMLAQCTQLERRYTVYYPIMYYTILHYTMLLCFLCYTVAL
jgi:hypothetical protein